MKKVKITVLASDFEGNDYMNVSDENGCPLTRAFQRAGIHDWYQDVPGYKALDEKIDAAHLSIDLRVRDMFNKKLPIEDFSFEI
jgi:hypothetical protein